VSSTTEPEQRFDPRGGFQESKMRHECVIIADSPGALVELSGISILERLLRTLQRCGVKRATVLSSTPELISKALAQPSWPRAEIDLRVCHRSDGVVSVEQIVASWPETGQFLLVIRGNVVFDGRLLRLLLAQNSTTGLVDSSVPEQFDSLVASAQDTNAGRFTGAALLQYDWTLRQNGSFDEALRAGVERRSLAVLDVAEQPFYDTALRRKLRPFWFPAPSASNTLFAEGVLLDSVQKGSLDFPAWIHAPIEKFLISHLCRTPITPHQLTIAWIVLACITTILFALGHLIWGIALALIVGILDGLDGKQARIKVETSKSGKLEHRFDSLFEVAWPSALAYHFYTTGQLPGAFIYLSVLLLAEALDGIGKAGVYSTSEKLMDEPGPFDRIVRLVGGRRNIYIWVLAVAVILRAPAKALVVMAWWEGLTAAVDLAHAAWSLRLLHRKKP
jgi:phosphatidylglycerophosphate synthase